jgi:muramoyltetrapeptide carboxypeptidase
MSELQITLPNAITKGAKFGFFSPSEPIYPRRVEFIKKAVEIIHDWGFLAEEITEEMFQDWSVLRSPKVRADELHEKLVNAEFDGLIGTWGGKNSNDLLSLLDYELIRKINKPIIGSSDIGVLLNAITKRTQLVTYYGPNVLGKLNQTEEKGMPLLFDPLEKTVSLFPNLRKDKIKILRHGKCEGRLVGGSLGTFTLGLSGTDFMPKYDKTIFFFESASLNYFRIRQHLQNLKTTGFTQNVVGLIVGATIQINDESIIPFEEMLSDLFSGDIPIVTTEMFGHGFYYNPTFPIGRLLNMDTAELSFHIEPERD